MNIWRQTLLWLHDNSNITRNFYILFSQLCAFLLGHKSCLIYFFRWRYICSDAVYVITFRFLHVIIASNILCLQVIFQSYQPPAYIYKQMDMTDKEKWNEIYIGANIWFVYFSNGCTCRQKHSLFLMLDAYIIHFLYFFTSHLICLALQFLKVISISIWFNSMFWNA